MTLLFAYGTLRDEDVQLAHFGRELTGREDTLPGYVRQSGPLPYPNVLPSANPEDAVDGTLYEITEQELAAADRYEGDGYKRILVTLRSGEQAWVYVGV